MDPANLKFVALPISEIIGVTSYRLSVVTSIFTRFWDIDAFVLQHDTFPHPTSSLPQISPCSPVSRWMAFGLRRAKVLG